MLRAALDAVVLFKTDAEKDDGLELAEEYVVTGYPTFALMNPKGELINVWTGYGAPKGFIDRLDMALADPILMTARRARYADQPTERDADVLAGFHAARDEYVEAVDLLRVAIRLAPDGHTAYRHRIFTNTAFGHLLGVVGEGDTLFTKREVQRAADELLADPEAQNETVMNVAQLMRLVAGQTSDPSLMIPYIRAAVEATDGTTDPGLRAGRESLLIDYALHVSGDAERAIELKRAQMGDGWMEDPSALNRFAWWCFENGINLDEAETLARTGVTLAEPGPPRARILDTLAEICQARGKLEEAVEFIRQAVTEAPEVANYGTKLARLEALTDGKR